MTDQLAEYFVVVGFDHQKQRMFILISILFVCFLLILFYFP